MKDKTRFILVIVFYGVLLGLLLPIFIYALLAFSNPSAYNYRIDYLQPWDDPAGYLHTGEYAVSLTFLGLLFVSLLLGLLHWIFRKKSTQLAVSLLLGLVAIGYAIARSVFCFGKGGTSSLPAILYILSAFAIAGSLYFFVKKTLDGDCSWPYYACLILGGAFLFVASCMKYSYSILNAMGHQGDIVYWGSYGISRLVLLSYLLGGWLNLSLDYDPSPKQAK